MKSPSNDENNHESQQSALDNANVQSVKDALDHAVSHLPENIVTDIARARTVALNNALTSSKKSVFDTCLAWLSMPVVNVGGAVTAAIMVAISINYVSVDAIPELPVAMMATEMPHEDFALLEDLEFVTWLAENEQSTLL